ncbi:MAG: DNA mismatch repair protein MutS [Verrucomicrobiaceae bacterium]|nr:MAG: DNA mismatch repair protein MutS [Verrucomicrobiaceae bacterium]
MDDEEPVEILIRDEIDLHTFRPNEIGELLPEYFHACREKGILAVRVIHGKGTGTLREGVVRLLDKLPEVESYQAAGAGSGGWGATWVYLAPL